MPKTKKEGYREVALTGEEVEECCFGMTYASLAITDNKDGTLKKVGKANPWHIEALKIITGNEEHAHKPLTRILDEDLELELDAEIDISGMTYGGHFLDTQGYIAHNSETIVLAYRCTTTAFDWMTNFNSTSSAWEKQDMEAGWSGFCSGLEGLCCTLGGEYRPRVHTGFYNNFLASVPMIKQHIYPLLGNDQPPRKLYVVGHSLGAGIATLAGCYFMQEFDWNSIPQTLVNVTAGSPRACCVSMKHVMEERMEELGSSVHVYRIVKGSDVVTRVPPKSLGFRHLVEAVTITDEGKIVRHHAGEEDQNEKEVVPEELEKKIQGSRDVMTAYDTAEGENSPSKYDKMVVRIPKALRDHMPDFYLKPLLRANGTKHPSLRMTVSHASTMDDNNTTTGFKYPKPWTTKRIEEMRNDEKKHWSSRLFRKNKKVNPDASSQNGTYF